MLEQPPLRQITSQKTYRFSRFHLKPTLLSWLLIIVSSFTSVQAWDLVNNPYFCLVGGSDACTMSGGVYDADRTDGVGGCGCPKIACTTTCNQGWYGMCHGDPASCATNIPNGLEIWSPCNQQNSPHLEGQQHTVGCAGIGVGGRRYNGFHNANEINANHHATTYQIIRPRRCGSYTLSFAYNARQGDPNPTIEVNLRTGTCSPTYVGGVGCGYAGNVTGVIEHTVTGCGGWQIATISCICLTACQDYVLSFGTVDNGDSSSQSSFITAVKMTTCSYYWDLDNCTAGAGGGTSPDGTWNTTCNQWSNSCAGTTATTTWVCGEDAIFSAGSTATADYTVCINNCIKVGSIELQNEGGDLILSDINGCSKLTFCDLSPDVTIACGRTIDFQVDIDGCSGMHLYGGGTAVLSDNAKSFDGSIFISENSTLELGMDNATTNAQDIVMTGGTLSSGSGVGYDDTFGHLVIVTDGNTLELGTGSHDMKFSDFTGPKWWFGDRLTVTGWTGVWGQSGTDGHFLVAISSGIGLQSTRQTGINFTGYQDGYFVIDSSVEFPGYYEIVPYGFLAPETSTVMSISLSLVIILGFEYRRRKRLKTTR